MSRFANLTIRTAIVLLAYFSLVIFCGAQQKPGAARVTKASLVANYSKTAPCPLTVTFAGEITTNGPAEVKYTWVSMDGGTWPERTIKFAKAGTEKVSEQRQVPSKQTGWMQLKVLSPNTFFSPRASYSVACGGAAGAGKVTKASLGAIVPAGKKCPLTVSFNGTITTNGPGEVKYTWASMDGGTWPEKTLNFTKAGTMTVHEQREVPGNQAGWMQVKTVSPNTVLSPRANYKVVCPK